MKKVLVLLMAVTISSCAIYTYNGDAREGSNTTSVSNENAQEARPYELTQSQKEMIKSFPPAKSMEDRYILWMPKKSEKEEMNRMVKITPYVTTEVDCNHYSLEGEFTTGTVKGYGYEFYRFNSEGQLMGTMMACPDDTKTTQEIMGTSKIKDYDSRTPIVVYVPKGIQIKTDLFVKE